MLRDADADEGGSESSPAHCHAIPQDASAGVPQAELQSGNQPRR
jgi:hypothetical protein